MTNPFHAVDVPGKGRYYQPCGPTCPLPQGEQLISVTNAQDVIAKPALVPAAVKVTADTAWLQLPRMVALSRQPPEGNNGCDRKRVADRCGGCRFCLTSQIKAEHKNQWESKAELGTRVHTHAHARTIGQPIEVDLDVEPFIAQHQVFLDRWRVDLDRHVEASELTVFDAKAGYAGTGDIWIHLPLDAAGRFTAWDKRKLWLLDIKTSLTKPATATYPDQVLQLAGLRYAKTAVPPDDSAVPVPTFTGAALLNLRQTEHALIPLPADRAAHRAFLAAVELRRYFHQLDTKPWKPLHIEPAHEKN